MKILVEKSFVPRFGKWHWDIKHNGYYNSGFARTKPTAYLSAGGAAVDYAVRRFLALQLRKTFLRVSKGVLSTVEMLYRF